MRVSQANDLCFVIICAHEVESITEGLFLNSHGVGQIGGVQKQFALVVPFNNWQKKMIRQSMPDHSEDER